MHVREGRQGSGVKRQCKIHVHLLVRDWRGKALLRLSELSVVQSSGAFDSAALFLL